MKNICSCLIVIISFLPFALSGQESIIELNTNHSGATHDKEARYAVLLKPGFSFNATSSTSFWAHINPNLAYPPIDNLSYNSFVDPEDRTLDKSLEVGTTAGGAGVSILGSATYTIPISLPAGANGFAPELSLVYSSNAEHGIAGYGWNIGGLSAVTRSPQNYYHDGTRVGVDLERTDRFSLDGKRLICVSGEYGTDNSEYRTEIDNISKIICFSDGTATPKRFHVKTKSGETIEYGYESDSDQTIDGQTEEVSWYIDKRTDLYGNTIEYEYIKQNGNNYINEIKYGPNKIVFYYKEKSDKEISFIAGSTIEQSLILDKVEIVYNSALVKYYKLKYNYHSYNYNSVTVLNEVIEHGGDNSRYNSTVFSYSYPTGDCSVIPENPFATNIIHTNPVSINDIQYSGDFNGDGRTDIFAVSKANLKDWRLFLANSNGLFDLSASGTNGTTIDGATVSDLNADGLDDLILIDLYGTRMYYKWKLSTGTSFGSSYLFAYHRASKAQFDSYYDFYANSNKYFGGYTSDFDGDGFNDFLIIDQENKSWRMFSFTKETNGVTFLENNRNGSVNSWGDEFQIADFNGDGKADVWTFDTNGIKIYSYNGINMETIYAGSYPKKDHLFKLGDFNGDGKTDIFLYGFENYEWGNWQFRLSNGEGFVANYFGKKKTDLKSDLLYTGDFNGDGCTDILALTENTSGDPRQYYFITRRNAQDVNSEYHDRTHFNKDYQFTLGDYDGNGKTDIIVTYSPLNYRIGRMTGNTDILLSRVANGLNNKQSFTYQKLTGNHYSKRSSAIFPVMDYQGDFTVVRSLASDDGLGGKNTVTYSYGGAKVHRQGKGFIGFSQINMYDAANKIYTIEYFDYDNTRYYARLKKTKKEKWVTGTPLISEITNTWDYHSTTGRTGFPYISISVQNNALTGQVVTNTFEYEDAYGNLKERKTIYEKGNKDVTLTVTNNIITNDVTNWRLGKVEQVIEKAEAPGEDPIVKTTNITYSTDGILKPDFIKVHEGTDLYYSRDHDYDSYGNLVQLVERGANVSAKQTNYTYDPINGIRIKTMIDPSSHETEYFYDGYGRLTKVEDYLDNSTAYLYDNMGRRKTVSSPGGFVTNTKIEWGDDANLEHELYYIENSGNDNSRSITWCDTLGRVIRRDIRGFDGNDIYTRTIYDNKGQIDKVSLPSTFANTLLYNDYTFDDYGRIDLIAHHSGRNDDYSYEYGSSKVTQTVGEKTSWKITDSQGLLTFAHDNGGDITYTYYPNGQVKNIAAPGNGQITSAVTAMKYDIAGNQTELSDPSAGTIIYKYDAFGRLKEQTNGRSQKTIYNYYADGRINNIQNPVTKEGTTTYSYNGLEQLTGISNSATNVSKSFIYENTEVNGRLKTIEETIDGKVFSTTFEYDGIGRIKQRIHPSDIVEENVYQNGYLKGIKANNDLVWQVNNMNEFGQITGSSYGGEHTATHNFTAYGLPDDVTTGNIQSYDYTFDDTQGWPNYRENRNKANCYESFEYDTKNRLDLVKHGGTPWIDMEYQDNGNIITKTDVAGGTNIFEYNHSTIPYALTDVNVASIIPEVPQHISYTSFEQPDIISENKYKALFTYNDTNQRCKMLMQQNGVEKYTRYYVGSRYMEQTLGGVTTESYTWIGGDAYSAPAVSVKIGTGASKIYYLFRDYLGTITHVVEKGNPTNNSEYSFDAWGRRRKAANWNDYNLNGEPALFAARGFTGHEHLPEFGLINMNGRLYNPVLGRFLSPDNYVQAADFTQSYNRYSYALNNPLIYTDPTGNKWRWGNPFYHFNKAATKVMDWVNRKLQPVSDAMVDVGVPSFGAGYNSTYGGGFYVGNNPMYYPGYEKRIATGQQGISNQVAGFSGMGGEPSGSGDIAFNQQFVGQSPLAQNIANSGEVGGVFFMQAEGRIVCPIGELGFTTSIQAGIIFDANFNVAAYLSPSLGGSSGGGYFYGVSVGYFPNAKSVSEIKGWGASAGAIYAVGKSFGMEVNAAIGDNDFRLGATLSTPLSGGFGGAGYAEFSYSFMTNPINVLNLSSQEFASFLNSNLPNSNYSANDALQILHYMYSKIYP